MECCSGAKQLVHSKYLNIHLTAMYPDIGALHSAKVQMLNSTVFRTAQCTQCTGLDCDKVGSRQQCLAGSFRRGMFRQKSQAPNFTIFTNNINTFYTFVKKHFKRPFLTYGKFLFVSLKIILSVGKSILGIFVHFVSCIFLSVSVYLNQCLYLVGNLTLHHQHFSTILVALVIVLIAIIIIVTFRILKQSPYL